MPKRKGLGQEIQKCTKVMESLHDCLEEFEKAPLKEGLRINKALNKDVTKMVNDAKEDAAKLAHQIEDIRNKIDAIRTDTDDRFGGSRTAAVIENFLRQVQ